jgi:hypothetical protein
MGEKKKLRSENAELRQELSWAKTGNADLRTDYAKLAETVRQLRIENERLVLTPQAKIDTEAAYQRGFQAARRNLRAWAVSSISDLEARLVTGGEKPKPKINPTMLFGND